MIKYYVWEIRKKKQLSLKELSVLSGVGKSTINDIETGKIINPTFYTIYKLSLGLNVNLYDLFSDE